MKKTTLLKTVAGLVVAVALAALAWRTRSAGHGDCPQCGHTRELHTCRHGCGWTACLACWQDRSRYGECPGCGRGSA